MSRALSVSRAGEGGRAGGREGGRAAGLPKPEVARWLLLLLLLVVWLLL